MSFKYKVGETVEVKMAFAMINSSLVEAPGFKAKVVERKCILKPRYKLKGYSGWWSESTLFKSGKEK